jgi:choline dehydrogenase-like flavoprotein
MPEHDPAPDILVIGSGMGGGTLAHALAGSGARVTILERGERIPSEPGNWSVSAVFLDGRYKASEQWQDATGRWYSPGITYAVGGNTKVYGAALPRLRPSDFERRGHAEGESPAWPFTYLDLAPHYAEAERIFGVHGAVEPGQEHTRTADFPFPPVPHEPAVQQVADRLSAQGFTPAHLPLGIDLEVHGRCVRCSRCDAFVCALDAKADADVRCVRPALKHKDVNLLTGAFVRRILTDSDGSRATGAEVEIDGQTRVIEAGTIVVSAGAVNSAALLLRSANHSHPHGVGNGSGVVGRHYMVHNNTVMLAARPLRPTRVVFQKTMYINDFYDRGVPDHPDPLGHIQLIGRVDEPMTRAEARLVPRWARRYVTRRAIAWWLYSEDLPDPANRVEITADGHIKVSWRPNNLRAHEVLTREARRIARASGYPIALTRRAGQEVCSHQAGTVRAGTDPATSALDRNCKAHELNNVYVVDSSFFPSLPVMNPALTIAANALRVAAKIRAGS